MGLEFASGSSQYVGCGNGASLRLTTAFTLMAWIKRSEDTNDLEHIISKVLSSTTRSYAMWLDTKKVGVYASGDGGAGNRGYVLSVGALSPNTKYHLAVTYDGSGPTLKVYIDAVDDTGTGDSDGDWTSLYNTADEVRLGHGNWGANYYFDGEIFDARIYNRILSLAEIKAIYFAQGSDNIVNGLVGRWLMNEKPDGETATAANSIIDLSGNGNHGSPANSPIYRAGSVKLVKKMISFPTPWIIAERERNILYDLILELSKTRSIVYDSILELSKTRDILYDSVLSLSKERDVVYDSILELSKTRDIVYDSVLSLSKERSVVYDSVLELSKERNIVYDLVLYLSQERNILYDLYAVLERAERPSDGITRLDAVSGAIEKLEKISGDITRLSRPFRG